MRIEIVDMYDAFQLIAIEGTKVVAEIYVDQEDTREGLVNFFESLGFETTYTEDY